MPAYLSRCTVCNACCVILVTNLTVGTTPTRPLIDYPSMLVTILYNRGYIDDS